MGSRIYKTPTRGEYFYYGPIVAIILHSICRVILVFFSSDISKFRPCVHTALRNLARRCVYRDFIFQYRLSRFTCDNDICYFRFCICSL